MAAFPANPDTLKETPLRALHESLGGKMVPFAGYLMPVQFPMGIMGEHLWTRSAAGLFDVSHMGQAFVTGPSTEAVAFALERLVPGDIAGLAPGRIRYTLLVNEEGGIEDDLMVTRPAQTEGRLFMVANAACKDSDFARISASLPAGFALERREDRALLALQGPKAAAALERFVPGVSKMSFMTSTSFEAMGLDLWISRSGYTGEDGFEISVPGAHARPFAERLLADPDVKPIGLGARDSLRLEAGLCLYGHDIDQGTSPIEAALQWTIPKRRREAADFPGARRIVRELKDGPARRRVGLRPEGRQPVREGAAIFAKGAEIGRVTSGGFGPSLEAPVAMGYVAAPFAAPGTAVELEVRGRRLPARVAGMPFVPHRYIR